MPSPNKRKLDVLCGPELVKQLNEYKETHDMSMSKALGDLIQKGLDSCRSEDGGFLSKEALELAEMYDLLDRHGKKHVKVAADLEEERMQEQMLEQSAAGVSRIAARGNRNGPIREGDAEPFLNREAKETTEEF